MTTSYTIKYSTNKNLQYIYLDENTTLDIFNTLHSYIPDNKIISKIEFTNRLKKILNYHQLTASLFADKIGVQRSSISHILSGRNKPSLDFILKVTNTFTDVDIYWLLNGKGEFPKEQGPTNKVFSSNESSIVETSNSKSSKKMNRIVVFYEDGTFEEYKKNNY